MSSPFPLLRLPGVVLFEVFKSLSIGEKIKLFVCSKRISTQINYDRLYSQKVIVDLHDEKIVVHFENKKDRFEIFISQETEKTLRSYARQYSIACYTQNSTRDSRLENKDLDELLKNWKAGGYPNLEYLYVKSQNITNNGTMILGINLREVDGMDVQTDDGSKKATIELDQHYIEMSVTSIE